MRIATNFASCSQPEGIAMQVNRSNRAVKSSVRQLGKILAELVRLYCDPSTAPQFAACEAALVAALARHQFLCSAVQSDRSARDRREWDAHPSRGFSPSHRSSFNGQG
jgi:hypothetical protein